MSDYKKYADAATRGRALEEALSRLRSAPFVAALGPLAVGIMKLLDHSPSPLLRYAVLATAPLALLLLAINYLRLPPEGKTSRRAIVILLLTLLLAAATLFLPQVLTALAAVRVVRYG